MKFHAAIHGVDLDKKKEEGWVEPKEVKQDLLFGDPADYDNYSEEEREKLTKKMMSKWGRWASTKPLKGQEMKVTKHE